MATVKAIKYNGNGSADILKYVDAPKPTPEDHEVLIKVAAAGVNPVDYKIRTAPLWPMDDEQIPGWDVAGTVESAPADSGFKAGDEVFAYTRPAFDMHDAHPKAASETVGVRTGTYAEYVVVPAWKVAPIPKSLTVVQAAGVPLAALTAYQALMDHLKIQKGQTVLILAASGGVGGYAVGIAKAAGATVIGTCSTRNVDYVKGLGADRVVDYTKEDAGEVLKGTVDAVFDCVGVDSAKNAFKAMKPGSKIVSIAHFGIGADAKEAGFEGAAFLVRPGAEQLGKLAELIDNGSVKVPKITTMPLAEAAQAHRDSESRRVVGKIILTV